MRGVEWSCVLSSLGFKIWIWMMTVKLSSYILCKKEKRERKKKEKEISPSLRLQSRV